MILDTLAGLLLLALWLFGGAAFFDSHQTEYKFVLLGWTVLNGAIVLACFLFWAVFWALERLHT
jgi:hypothetical protein